MPPGTAHAPPRLTRLRTRPLSRDRGGDARSAALAESMEAHQRAISVHQDAMLRDIAEFSRTEAFRGDGALVHGGLAERPLPAQRRLGPHLGADGREPG